jgi:hypothetical protein
VEKPDAGVRPEVQHRVMVEPDDFVYCEHGEDPATCEICNGSEELPVVDVQLMLERHREMLRDAPEVPEDLIGHPLG